MCAVFSSPYRSALYRRSEIANRSKWKDTELAFVPDLKIVKIVLVEAISQVDWCGDISEEIAKK